VNPKTNVALFIFDEILKDDASKKSLWTRFKDCLSHEDNKDLDFDDSFSQIFKDLASSLKNQAYEQLIELSGIFHIHYQLKTKSQLQQSTDQSIMFDASVACEIINQTAPILNLMQDLQAQPHDLIDFNVLDGRIKDAFRLLTEHELTLQTFSKDNLNHNFQEMRIWMNGEKSLSVNDLCDFIQPIVDIQSQRLDQIEHILEKNGIYQQATQAYHQAKLQHMMRRNLLQEVKPLQHICSACIKILARSLYILKYTLAFAALVLSKLSFAANICAIAISLLKLLLNGEPLGQDLFRFAQSFKVRHQVNDKLTQLNLHHRGLSRNLDTDVDQIELKSALKAIKRHQKWGHRLVSLLYTGSESLVLAGMIGVCAVHILAWASLISGSILAIANPIGSILFLTSIGLMAGMMIYKLSRAIARIVKKSKAENSLKTASSIINGSLELKSQAFKNYPLLYRQLAKKFAQQNNLDIKRYHEWNNEQLQSCNQYIYRRSLARSMRYDLDITIRSIIQHIRTEKPAIGAAPDSQRQPFTDAMQALMANPTTILALAQDPSTLSPEDEKMLVHSFKKGLNLI